MSVARSQYDQVDVGAYPVLGYNVCGRSRCRSRKPYRFHHFRPASRRRCSWQIVKHRRGIGTCHHPEALSESLGFPYGDWESLGYHAAIQAELYNLMVTTVRDSTSNSGFTDTYVVTAHTADPFVYFVSAADSGYSVDNLAPEAPQGLAVSMIPRPTCSPSRGMRTWSLTCSVIGCTEAKARTSSLRRTI